MKLPLALLLFGISQTAASLETIKPRFLQDKSYGDCDGCYCIRESGEECPGTSPRTDWTTMIPVYRNLTWTNPYSIDCDPYADPDTCDTTPPLEQGGACVVTYETPTTARADTCPSSYSVSTYAGTYQEAEAAGLVVTHSGACGACSSLQDLSVYMEQGANMRTSSQGCGFRGISDPADGVLCFQQLGMTDACAAVWYYNTKSTSTFCAATLCGAFVLSGDPPNGPAPTCELAACLQCDEDNSGPIFEEYAGRNRRNSGLLSEIVRPCSSNVYFTEHYDPCTGPSTLEPTAAPSASDGRRVKTVQSVVIVTLLSVVLYLQW
jgi:hypothetical protein